MPRLNFKTHVKSNFTRVVEAFNEDLFKVLSPPFPKVVIQRFDGCRKGDEVHIKLNFILFSTVWKSLITSHSLSDNVFEFVDEGILLPFPLIRWHHTHRITSIDPTGSTIIDDIRYSTTFFMFDWLTYPFFWLMFAYRQPIYRKIFGS